MEGKFELLGTKLVKNEGKMVEFLKKFETLIQDGFKNIYENNLIFFDDFTQDLVKKLQNLKEKIVKETTGLPIQEVESDHFPTILDYSCNIININFSQTNYK